MTCCNILPIKIIALGLITAATLTALPAHAASKKDIQKCRDAATQETSVDMSDYRLRFLRETGNRNRKITLKAIPHKKGESFEFTCSVKHSEVQKISLNEADIKLLAQNETAKKE